MCKLSFVYVLVTSRVNLTVRTKPKFGKFVVLFVIVILKYFTYSIICSTHV